MKATRFTECIGSLKQQIVQVLREMETGGKKAADKQRDLGISAIWKRKYGGLEVNETMRLKESEPENNKLKWMEAN